MNEQPTTPPDEAPMQPVWGAIENIDGSLFDHSHWRGDLDETNWPKDGCRISELIERSTHDRALAAKDAEIARWMSLSRQYLELSLLDADGLQGRVPSKEWQIVIESKAEAERNLRTALGQEGGE